MKRHPKGSALRTITLANLLEAPFPVREDLITPWLRQGESVMIWAATGVGKTMLSLSMALAVAGGGGMIGWTAPKPRAVLYVDGEMHIQDLRDRLRMLSGSVEGCDLEAAGRNLTILSRQHQDANADFPDLATPEGQEVILAGAERVGAELVILDNFSTLADVPDENEAAAMSPVLSFLLKMKQAGRACILVHHSGKGGDSYRGSSKLATTFEVIVGLKKPDGRSTTEGAAFSLTWEKFRGAPTEATRDADVVLGGTAEDRQWTSTPAANAEMALMLEELRTCRHGTQQALGKALGWDKWKVSRIKARAIEKGAITERAWKLCLDTEGGQEEGTPSDF